MVMPAKGTTKPRGRWAVVYSNRINEFLYFLYIPKSVKNWEELGYECETFAMFWASDAAKRMDTHYAIAGKLPVILDSREDAVSFINTCIGQD